jgi:myo-inositol 2-dehydrogenase / D-chiro-inositol 1-dehydrogenase
MENIMGEKKLSSRRDFMKDTSAIAAGMALAGGLNFARTSHAAGNDELKVCLIGCGGRGMGAAMDCLSSSENIKIVAVADAFEDKATDAAKKLAENFPKQSDVPKERTFVGFDAYQKAIDSGVDLVIMAPPPGFRPLHYAAAIKAGKHVFMEKPCCVDAPGFRSLMETNKLADEKGLKVGVGLQRRHQKNYQTSIKKIQDGDYGDITLLRAYWNGGPIWIRNRIAGQSEMQYQMWNWYHFVWLSGDHITEQHVHNLDVCNWAKDAHPVQANGMGSCHCRNNKGVGQIYDNHFVEFTYPDGTKMYSQCRQQPNTWSAVCEAIHGTKGVWESEKMGRTAREVSPYRQEHIDLIAAIKKNEKYNEGWFGATSSMTAVLGRMATYSGQTVTWDDAVANGPNEMPAKYAFDANPPAMPDKDGNYPMPIPGQYKAC